MQGNPVQKSFAYAALFLLPFPALNFGISITYADLFLVAAILLNASELTRIHAFQIPFLLSVPFFLLSSLFDVDGSAISLTQTIYIWGVVLPFGWVAFANLTVPRIAQVILLSSAISATVAIGQSLSWVPELAHQHIVDFGRGFPRAAGLSILCNSLAMGLSPCFLLLSYVRQSSVRPALILVLIGGLLASVSRSALVAIPGLCFYLVFREPCKKKVLTALLLAILAGWTAIGRYHSCNQVWANFNDTVEQRINFAEDSFEVRYALVDIALDYANDCHLLGYGTEGTQDRIGQLSDNTVHVYYLGLIVIAGFPGATLVVIGMGMLLWGLWRADEMDLTVFLVVHLLACTAMTVLLFSFQSMPFMVAGAVLVHQTSRTRQPNRVSVECYGDRPDGASP